ncbi:unnamed protein product [Urochloa humidicola]
MRRIELHHGQIDVPDRAPAPHSPGPGSSTGSDRSELSHGSGSPNAAAAAEHVFHPVPRACGFDAIAAVEVRPPPPGTTLDEAPLTSFHHDNARSHFQELSPSRSPSASSTSSFSVRAYPFSGDARDDPRRGA